VPRGQPESQTRGLEARRLTLCLANPRLGSVNSLDPEMDPAFAGSIKGVGGWDLK
jgi:hypothetical protein